MTISSAEALEKNMFVNTSDGSRPYVCFFCVDNNIMEVKVYGLGTRKYDLDKLAINVYMNSERLFARRAAGKIIRGRYN